MSSIIELTRPDGGKVRVNAGEIALVICDVGGDNVAFRINGCGQDCPVRETFEEVCELIARHWGEWEDPERTRGTHRRQVAKRQAEEVPPF